jgi:aspartate-semialdehyde dehydrogenase
MSSNFKSAAMTHTEPLREGNSYRVAIVGAGTLKGKEVAEVLGDRNFPSLDIKLLDDDESLGQLETVGEEITFIQTVRAEQFDNIDFTFFASDPDCTRKNWKAARKAGSAIVDLSYALEDEPDARLRSSWIERQIGKIQAPELLPGPSVVAHPAAVLLALLLLRTQKAGGIRQVVATGFEPASEHGQRGIDELHEQTVNLLSFQQMPKAVFDAQVAFNMLARYGQDSSPSLATIESRVLKHFRRITPPGTVTPSFLLLQAPIFHGHAFAIHIQMEKAADLVAISSALAGEHVNVTPTTEDAPSNVSAAGQADILVSMVPDASDTNSLWMWAASDNLRIAAATAVECAESMAASRPRGKIQ